LLLDILRRLRWWIKAKPAALQSLDLPVEPIIL
jgi:hypothetical protein